MKRFNLLLLAGLLIQISIYGQKSALVIEEPVGSKPWNNLNINDKPGQFQFAIVTDRTGGRRPGIFHGWCSQIKSTTTRIRDVSGRFDRWVH